MRITIAILLIFSWTKFLVAQEKSVVSGVVINEQSKEPIANALVKLKDAQTIFYTQSDGRFKLVSSLTGDFVLNISYRDFVTKRIPINLENGLLDLGTIYLNRDITLDQTDNLITLTDSELLDDEVNSNSTGLLQATRDVFLNKAAFDFGQAFFRVRGYDSRNGMVLINGIPMNKMFDGRPQWNNWGGLNDVFRNQQFTNGLEASDFIFGGLLGNTNIDTHPSRLRPGTRLSSSASNRTYAGRLMATYNSGMKQNGLAYIVSGSRRWARQGYIDGTLYDALSFFGALEFRPGKNHTFALTGIFASNRRGRSSAIIEEVFELIGNNYNPHWGEQDGKVRNARERKIKEPILMLNHTYTSDKFSLNSGIAYQFGTNARSRLGYFNAPNPDPTYYRYLPSFYINSPIGANFVSANLAKDGFLHNPQMDWNKFYTANSQEQAAYVLYDDVAEDSQMSLASTANLIINDNLKTDFGVTFIKLNSDNYAKIHDLFGADFHEDIDPFSSTLNDTNGNIRKREGDTFNYNYIINSGQWNAFTQFQYYRNKWNTFLSGSLTGTVYQRSGLYKNERFIDSSYGDSKNEKFSDFAVKGGFTYRLNGRHWFTTQGTLLTRPPVLQNTFINPRENNQVVPDLQKEKVSSVDMNYYIRLPKLTGRCTGFYTGFQNTTDINFFFVDAGVGSDFVQEVLTDMDKLHMGLELGLEYQLSASVKLITAVAIGKYLYASDPSVSINFDTAAADEDLIDPKGSIDLGVAKIKDYKLAVGPQKAMSLGIEYRDPKYWWIGATANYLANNYANISTITRTQSFYLDPDTGLPFADATDKNVNKLLNQKPLDNFYLLNLVGGKSWLKGGKYISIFVSINNVFDAIFRTGGYEQSRNGNFGQLQQDNLSGTPSFAPKYWYGYGRTYFLNLAFSF